LKALFYSFHKKKDSLKVSGLGYFILFIYIQVAISLIIYSNLFVFIILVNYLFDLGLVSRNS